MLEFIGTEGEENHSYSEVNDKYIHYIDYHLQPTPETPKRSPSTSQSLICFICNCCVVRKCTCTLTPP